MSYGDPAQLTIETLWNDFEKRTWCYNQLISQWQVADRRRLNWIGSIDGSGYTRENCLRELIDQYQSGDENRILLRLTDWVPQVRAIAQAWVLEHFASLGFATIRANQALILYLSRKQMLRDDQAMSHIKDVLLDKVESINGEEFRALLPKFRRFLYRLSLDGTGSLRWRLHKDPDPFNRLLLLSFHYNNLTPVEIGWLKNDKSVFVRREFLLHSIRSGVTPPESELRELALHWSRRLRDIGRFYLEKFYAVDTYEMYRRLDGDQSFYIADFEKREDVDLFLRGLGSSARATRRACLRALLAADPARLRELDLPALVASNRPNRELLCKHLPKHLGLDEIIQLEPAFGNSSSGRLSYLNLIERKSYWHFVAIGLRSLAIEESETIRQFVSRTIVSRSERFGILPPDLRARIDVEIKGLRRAGSRFTELLDMLTFTMRSCGGD